MTVDLLLDQAPWDRLESIDGSAQTVPDAVRALLGADDEEDATAAYWRLDNHVVVQGRLYDSAVWLVGPLVAALVGGLPVHVRVPVTDLLREIALGYGDDEPAAGEPGLVEHARAELRRGLWVFYGLLADPAPDVRRAVLYILNTVDDDRDRVAAALGAVRTHDAAPDIAELAGVLADA